MVANGLASSFGCGACLNSRVVEGENFVPKLAPAERRADFIGGPALSIG